VRSGRRAATSAMAMMGAEAALLRLLFYSVIPEILQCRLRSERASSGSAPTPRTPIRARSGYTLSTSFPWLLPV
jgi:hypothetical protein